MARTRLIDARSLLTPARLDYIVKWRFFMSLLRGPDPDAERLYRWHIMRRTGGQEPDGSKVSIDDYVHGCSDLLRSIQDHGFDDQHAVRINEHSRIIGTGAHRIAACIALGAPIAVRQTEPKRAMAADWDYEWFAVRGCSQRDLARIAEDFSHLLDRVAA